MATNADLFRIPEPRKDMTDYSQLLGELQMRAFAAEQAKKATEKSLADMKARLSDAEQARDRDRAEYEQRLQWLREEYEQSAMRESERLTNQVSEDYARRLEEALAQREAEVIDFLSGVHEYALEEDRRSRPVETRTVEVPVEKVVEKVVEKPAEVPKRKFNFTVIRDGADMIRSVVAEEQ